MNDPHESYFHLISTSPQQAVSLRIMLEENGLRFREAVVEDESLDSQALDQVQQHHFSLLHTQLSEGRALIPKWQRFLAERELESQALAAKPEPKKSLFWDPKVWVLVALVGFRLFSSGWTATALTITIIVAAMWLIVKQD